MTTKAQEARMAAGIEGAKRYGPGSIAARKQRLSAAREGVVKALRPFAREVEFLLGQGELMNDDDRVGRPLSATKSATRLVLVNLLDARDALKELEEAGE